MLVSGFLEKIHPCLRLVLVYPSWCVIGADTFCQRPCAGTFWSLMGAGTMVHPSTCSSLSLIGAGTSSSRAGAGTFVVSD